MKRVRMRWPVLVGAALLAAYLAGWPVPVEPVAWKAPAAPRLEGPYARNEGLARVARLGSNIPGPEATAFDASGRVHTGTRDGRVVRLDPATGAVETFAVTGGRPLGLAFDRAGNLVVCDARKGLLSISPSGVVETLAASRDGVHLANDLDLGPDGTVYFSDTSARFDIDHVREDVLEHGGTGRLLAWHPATRKTEALLGGLQFANGVAVAGDGRYLVVAETGAYRLTRYWLTGPAKGRSEPFIENLPGLPDNVTWSPARRAFWVALYSPRIPPVDSLAPYPFLRKVVQRLPLLIQPQPAAVAFALAVDEEGNVIENLQDHSPSSFAPVTSVREHGGFLFLGSIEQNALGRIEAPPPRSLSAPGDCKPADPRVVATAERKARDAEHKAEQADATAVKSGNPGAQARARQAHQEAAAAREQLAALQCPGTGGVPQTPSFPRPARP